MAASAEELTARLAKVVSALPDVAMRAAYLRDALRRLPISRALDVIVVAGAAAEAGDAGRSELLLALGLALHHRDSQDLREPIATLASSRGLDDLVHWLGLPGPGMPVAAGAVGAQPARQPSTPDGRPLTLGERKSLARRCDRRLLDRALRDPHPAVVEVLLGNPTLTEDDVVRLCARRPLAEEILREVARSTRWIVRRRVRMAIVLNPHAPVDLGMRLASLLSRADRGLVARSAELSPDLRRACRGYSRPGPVH